MSGKIILALVVSAAAALGQAGTGLGVIVGEPTGISAKLWTGGNTAVDVAAAWSVYRYQALHIHADLLFHNLELFRLTEGELPAYVGVGGRLKLAGQGDDQKMRLGLRVPVGLEYLFEPFPLGLFLEIAPVLDVLPGTGFGINGAVGGRWYFR